MVPGTAFGGAYHLQIHSVSRIGRAAARAGPGDVPAALADAGRWVRRLLGRPGATLVPLHRPEVWRIDEA